MAGAGSQRHQIRLWSLDDPSSLSYTERMHRISAVLDLVDQQTSGLNDSEKNAYAEDHLSKEIDYGVALLSSLEYSKTTKDIFKHAEAMALLAYADRYDGRHAAVHYQMARPEERHKILQEISDLFFQGLASYVPKLASPSIELSGKYDDACGWIVPEPKNINEKKYGPIFIHEVTNSFEEDINTVCHEATHHAMLQMVGLMAWKEVRFPEDMKKDLQIRRLQIEHGAYGRPPSLRLYHADPDEQLAHRTGMAIQCLYVASQNLGSIPKAWEMFKDNEHLIDIHARGSKPGTGLYPT